MNEGEDPKALVARGYDRMAERYLARAQRERNEERGRYTAVLLDGLPSGAEVLDLGCGAGLPVAQTLSRRFRVTGVDISARQIALARANVPEATFFQADMAQLRFPPESYDGVAAFYSLIHVPRQEQAGLLARIAAWLRPNGLLVATMGKHAMEADYDELDGERMYWSGFDSAENERLVRAAGLRLASACEETADEDGLPITFLWIVARKDGGA